MHIVRYLSILLLCLVLMQHYARAAEGDSAGGAITGTIKIWKTKVKTDGPKNGKTIVVYLEAATDTPPVKDKLITMDQKGLVFIPHVLAIQRGTSVEFLNNDPEKHNVYFLYDKTGETLDLGTWDQGQGVTHTFNESGNIIVLCKLHLEMAAHIIVLDNPYFCEAVVDDKTQKASFTIENIPPGKYTLKTWHKKLKMKGKQAEVTIEEGKTTDFNIVITKRKYAK